MHSRRAPLSPPFFRFPQNQFDLRFSFFATRRHESRLALSLAGHQHPRDLFHVVERFSLQVEIVAALADAISHAMIRRSRLTDHQHLSFAITSGDVSARAGVAQRFAVQRSTVLDSHIHLCHLFLKWRSSGPVLARFWRELT